MLLAVLNAGKSKLENPLVSCRTVWVFSIFIYLLVFPELSGFAVKPVSLTSLAQGVLPKHMSCCPKHRLQSKGFVDVATLFLLFIS